MGLQLAITDKRGVTANYHRIIAVTQVYEGEQRGIHINLAGYVNRSFRLLEALPADDANYQKNTAVMNTGCFLPFVDGEGFKLGLLYTRLKNELPELKLSTDALE